MERMPYGVLYGKIVLDGNGEPSDLLYLGMNESYKRFLGVTKTNIIGKAATEVFPELKDNISDWMSPYVNAAINGKETSFDRTWPLNSRHYRVSVFSPRKGYFTAITEDITDHHRSDEALMNERNRLDKAQHIAHIGSWDWDLQKGIFEASAEIYHIFGNSPEHIPSMGYFLERVHPLDRELVRRSLEEAIQLGYMYVRDYRVVREDGTQLLVHAEASVTYEDGRPVRIEGTVQDITERREAEEKYRQLYETMLEGVVYQDAEGQIISMNPAAERILGKSPTEFIGSSSVGQEKYCIHEDGTTFPGDEHPAMVSLRSGKELRDVVMGIYHPGEKDYRWIVVSAVPLFRSGDDRPHQVYTTFVDITERKRADRQIERTNQRLTQVLESIPESFYELNHDWVYTYANEKLAKAMGKEPEDFIGRTIWEMFPKQLGTPFERLLREAMEKREARRFETKDQYTDVWYLMSVFPTPGGISVLGSDITEQKRNEETLKENAGFSLALNRISSFISSTKDPEEIMQSVIEEGAKALEADSSLVNMREGDHWVASNIYKFPSDILGKEKRDEESPTSMLVAREMRVVAIEDANSDPRVDREAMRKYRIHSLLVAPFIMRDKVNGVIAFYYHHERVKFSDAQIDFATKLTGAMSMAMENTRLFEKVSESEVRYRGLFENIVEAASFRRLAYDEDGTVADTVITDANQAFLRSIGRSSVAEIRGKRFSELFSPENAAVSIGLVRKMESTGRPVTGETQLNNRDYLTSFVPIGDDHAINTNVDITEIKSAQRAVEETRAQLQAALESMTDAVFISDADGNFIDFNQAFATYYRFRDKEECFRSLLEYPEHIEVHMADGTMAPFEMWAVSRALRGETVTNAEDMLRRKGTGEVWWGS